MKQFVYVMQSDAGLAKIGIAADPVRRRSILQHANGGAVELVKSYGPFERATLVEREAHAALDALRESGEWFRCSAEDAASAVETAIANHVDIAPAEPAVTRAASEELMRQCAESLAAPAKRAVDMAEDLMRRLEEKTDECISMTKQFVEAVELLDFYATNAKDAQRVARTALDRAQRLEDELMAERRKNAQSPN